MMGSKDTSENGLEKNDLVSKRTIRSFEEVGGHPNQWFVDDQTTQGCVKKATTWNEALFYLWVKGASQLRLYVSSNDQRDSNTEAIRTIEHLKDSVPCSAQVDAGMMVALSQFIPLCKSLSIPLHPTDARHYYVEMENLLLKFTHPCVMDIKMGTRLYGDEATKEKRERMIRKSFASTSSKYGVRLTAWKIWNRTSKHYDIMTRQEASRVVSLQDFQQAFERYLNAAELPYRKPLALLFQEKIQLFSSWFSEQRLANFYSSSLLFLYDAEAPFSPDIRMIDFAHVTFNPPTMDQGYLLGLSTLFKILSTFIKKQCTPLT